MVAPSFRAAYIGFFIAILLGALLSQGQALWSLWRISANPISTRGQIVGVDCANHGYVAYSFDVGGYSHTAHGRFIDGINCRDLRVGQPIAVDYENGAPDNNYGLYPVEATGNRARAAFLTGVAFLGAFVVLGPIVLAGIWTLVARLMPTRS
jgi:hypothetical protein